MRIGVNDALPVRISASVSVLQPLGSSSKPCSSSPRDVLLRARACGARRIAGWEYAGVILPPVRDPRLVTIRRGGTLTDPDHRFLALWAAACAEHVLGLFETEVPGDLRPREAIEAARAWARGEVTMVWARARGGHAMGAARPLEGAARFAAYAAGQAACVGHVAEHDLGAAAYAIRAAQGPAVATNGSGYANAIGSAANSRKRCGLWSSKTKPVGIPSAGTYSATSSGCSSGRRCPTGPTHERSAGFSKDEFELEPFVVLQEERRVVWSAGVGVTVGE